MLQAAPAGAPSFSATLIAPAGWGYDPPGAEGLAVLASRLSVQSTDRHPRKELARLLDRYSATLTSHTDPESAEVTVWGPQDAWEPLLELLADAILRPAFAEAEVARVRQQLRERQLREAAQPDLRSRRELLGDLFPRGHPYRSTGLGRASSLRRLTRDAVRRFHRDHFLSRSSAIVVTSSVPPSAVRRRVDRILSDGSLRAPPADPPLPERPASSPDRRDIVIAGQSQVEVRVGGPSVPRSDARYLPLLLANEVLGGRPLLSRLFQGIRERMGLAYHASSELEAMRWGGYWQARAGTHPSSRDRVANALRAEVRRLSDESIPSSELGRIRESLLASMPLALETTADVHELAAEVAYYRLPTDYYLTWPERLRAVRPREIRDAAAAAWSPARMRTVTVGPAPARG